MNYPRGLKRIYVALTVGWGLLAQSGCSVPEKSAVVAPAKTEDKPTAEKARFDLCRIEKRATNRHCLARQADWSSLALGEQEGGNWLPGSIRMSRTDSRV